MSQGHPTGPHYDPVDCFLTKYELAELRRRGRASLVLAWIIENPLGVMAIGALLMAAIMGTYMFMDGWQRG